MVTFWESVEFKNTGSNLPAYMASDIPMNSYNINGITKITGSSGYIDLNNSTGIIIDSTNSNNAVRIRGDSVLDLDMVASSNSNNYIDLYDSGTITYSTDQEHEFTGPVVCIDGFSSDSPSEVNSWLYVDNLSVSGYKNCVVDIDGKRIAFSAIESPEIWFEEKLSGVTENNVKEIILADYFQKATTINAEHPLHVSICPTCNDSFWVEKFIDRVLVHSVNESSSFDITISAKRKGYEGIRFMEEVR
jgi:hypothetical protein